MRVHLLTPTNVISEIFKFLSHSHPRITPCDSKWLDRQGGNERKGSGSEEERYQVHADTSIWEWEKNDCWQVFMCETDCIIRALGKPESIVKMWSTFGTWMKDTAEPDDERIWVADHFSGSDWWILDWHCNLQPTTPLHQTRTVDTAVIRVTVQIILCVHRIQTHASVL